MDFSKMSQTPSTLKSKLLGPPSAIPSNSKVSELQPFPSSSANMTQPVTKKKTSALLIPDWSLLPEELLHIVSTHLEDCFDVVHARAVCSTWRSTFPFPSALLRPSYSLPSFAEFPALSEDLCTLQKIPLFLFRAKVPSLAANVLNSKYFWEVTTDVSTCDYFLGGIRRDESEDHMVLPSPIQCSMKLKIPRTDPTLLNMHDCQVLPLGHQYRMIGWDPKSWDTNNIGVAFIDLNSKKEEFVVLLNYYNVLLVLRSAEMRWVQVKETSMGAWCMGLVAFRGKFYANFENGEISVYDPYTLIETPLMHSQPLNLSGSSNLVRVGDDEELFLVEQFNPYPQARERDFNRFACRVSILDEEAGKWVVVPDLGDRVFFIGHYGNVSCSAKELPDGCGVSGNSIVFTRMSCETYAYKYGVDTGDIEDDLTFWRLSKENRVNCVPTSPMLFFGLSMSRKVLP